jgi:preprotein translocase subunit SecG
VTSALTRSSVVSENTGTEKANAKTTNPLITLFFISIILRFLVLNKFTNNINICDKRIIKFLYDTSMTKTKRIEL